MSGAGDTRNEKAGDLARRVSLDPKFRLQHLREPTWRYDTIQIAVMVLAGMAVTAFLLRWLVCLYWLLVAAFSGLTAWSWALYAQLQAQLRKLDQVRRDA